MKRCHGEPHGDLDIKAMALEHERLNVLAPLVGLFLCVKATTPLAVPILVKFALRPVHAPVATLSFKDVFALAESDKSGSNL